MMWWLVMACADGGCNSPGASKALMNSPDAMVIPLGILAGLAFFSGIFAILIRYDGEPPPAILLGYMALPFVALLLMGGP